MKTENKIEVRNVSMLIMKSLEIRKNFILISMPLKLFVVVYTCSCFVDMQLHL